MKDRGLHLRLVWGLFLVVAVTALIFVRVAATRAAAERLVGIQLEERTFGVLISEVTPGLPADDSGLREGDIILRLNGTEIRQLRDYDPVALTFEPGSSAIFEVLRDGAQIEAKVQPGARVVLIPLLLDGIVCLGYLALATLTLARPERNVRGRLLFVFSASIALELALPTGVFAEQGLVIATDTAFWLLTGLQIALELHLVALLPHRPRLLVRFPFVVPCAYASCLGLGALMALSAFDFRINAGALPWAWSQAAGLWSLLLMPAWALSVAGVLTYKIRTSTEALGRQQAGLVLIGTLPWVIYVVCTGVTKALELTLPSWVALLQGPALLCFPAAVFVAIFRYNLIDLERVVRRSLVYTLFSGALLLAFSVSVGVGSLLLPRLVGSEASVIAVATASLLLGLLFSPVRASVDAFIRRRVFPERGAQRQRLIALAGELPAYGRVPLMGQHLVQELSEIFSTDRVTLLVGEARARVLMTVASTAVNPDRDFSYSFLFDSNDPGVQLLARGKQPMPARQLAAVSASLAQRLHVFSAELVVPVISRTQVVGLILLGPREDGNPYVSDSIELLSMLGHHVGAVFENARLFESATVDGLTGLLRREAILELFDRELVRAIRYGRPLTVAMADLDHFKLANDHHGHLVGDTILKRVAQALVRQMRATDAVGRYGGEEFLLLLPETDLDGGLVVAEKIRDAVRSITIQLENGQTLGVTISIGLASLRDLPNPKTATATSLIKCADRNLLLAKREGRDRVEPGPVAAC